MSTVSDEMVEAAWAIIRSCGAPVGAGDGNTYIPHPPSKADVLRALEAAEAVRVKAESNLQKVQIPTSTIPEGFIPWHGGECPVAEGTKVETMLRNGEPWVLENAENFFWLHEDADDIIGYRIHKPADFRLEAGKYYIDARGERTRLVRGLTAPMPGLFHDGGARVWKADGTAHTVGDPDILALSSNQENSHE